MRLLAAASTVLAENFIFALVSELADRTRRSKSGHGMVLAGQRLCSTDTVHERSPQRDNVDIILHMVQHEQRFAC